MKEPERGFPVSEFKSRLALLQSIMRTDQLDIVFLCTEADIRYYTGYLTQFWQSPTRPWFLLVPQTGMPVAVIPSIGYACMSKTWVNDIRTWASPHPTDDGITLLADTVKELAGSAATVGLPMGRETHLRMPMADFINLKSMLPKCQWNDISARIQCLRQIKSELEIEKIKHVCTLVSNAFARVPDIVSSGMTELEVFRHFKIECLNQGVDDTAYLVGGADTSGYNDIISPPSTRKLQSGDLLILDTGCTWDGYFCDFDRNFAISKASAATLQAYQVTWEATDAGLDAAMPGTTCSQLFNVMNRVMQKHSVDGDGDVGRIGHGLGTQLTESPSITAHDHTILKPGMVMTLEPGYSFADGKMMVHEENIIIRDNGAELLTKRASSNIPIID